MRALFLGNSYTFYNDVPGQVHQLAAESGVNIEVDQVVEGGADWSLHAGRLGGLERIRSSQWDVVVLQGRSTDPLLKSRRFHKYGAILGKAAQDCGARVLLYQTWPWASDHPSYAHRWSKRSPQAWLDAVRSEYAKLARTLSVEVAPAGDAWSMALNRLDLELYDEDRHHASALGSHLSACVLVRTITRCDPRRLAWCPDDVDAGDSSKLKAIAAEV